MAVTGGAQGIGRAIAFHFAEAGYAVSIADRDENAGLEVVDKLRELSIKAVFACIDISKAGQVERWVEKTVREVGCPDVLVNNAGIFHNTAFLQLAVEDFDRVIGVNLRG